MKTKVYDKDVYEDANKHNKDILNDYLVEFKSKKRRPNTLEQNQIEGANVNNKVQQSRQKYASAREFLEAQERRLVIGECECEKDFHLWIDNPNQKELRFTCKRCEEDKVINLDDLVPATYKCSECGKQSSFWMEPEQAVAIDCFRY